MPNNTNWLGVYGVAVLTGVGFTMSLFVGNLAFIENTQYIDDVKIGVLFGSFVSAIFGYLILLLFYKK
jgi:NhaA family Na+:H+ antiporter